MFSTLSEEISRNILRDIIAGRFTPGSKLPTERDMSKQFGVARQVVRESLKYLQAIGVVTVRKRAGIIVNDLPISCFFENFELFLFREDGSIDMDCLKEILKFRSDINEHILRAAARNRTEEDLEEIRHLIKEFRETSDNQEQLIDIMIRYMKAISKATHNRMYQMLANTGANVLLKLQLLVLKTDVLSHDSDETMDQLLAAFEKKDEEIAVILGTRRLQQFDNEIIDRVAQQPMGWNQVA